MPEPSEVSREHEVRLGVQPMYWEAEQTEPMYWQAEQTEPMYWQAEQTEPMYWQAEQTELMYWQAEQTGSSRRGFSWFRLVDQPDELLAALDALN